MIKTMNHHVIYLDENNLYRWAMSQKLPADSFKWKKSVSKFDEKFIKDYDEESNNGYILKVDIDYPIIFIVINHFYQEE